MSYGGVWLHLHPLIWLHTNVAFQKLQSGNMVDLRNCLFSLVIGSTGKAKTQVSAHGYAQRLGVALLGISWRILGESLAGPLFYSSGKIVEKHWRALPGKSRSANKSAEKSSQQNAPQNLPENRRQSTGKLAMEHVRVELRKVLAKHAPSSAFDVTEHEPNKQFLMQRNEDTWPALLLCPKACPQTCSVEPVRSVYRHRPKRNSRARLTK